MSFEPRYFDDDWLYPKYFWEISKELREALRGNSYFRKALISDSGQIRLINKKSIMKAEVLSKPSKITSNIVKSGDFVKLLIKDSDIILSIKPKSNIAQSIDRESAFKKEIKGTSIIMLEEL